MLNRLRTIIRVAVVTSSIAVLAATMAAAATLDDAGLHEEPWIHETFKDLREDLADANTAGKRLLILVEQRGCSYCKQMHEEVFSQPDIAASLTDDYYVIRLNMFGDVEVTDFDGTALPEKDMVMRWGLMFTPTIMFMPEEVPSDTTAAKASVATMPGAFAEGTTRALLKWVKGKHYESGQNFQKYVAEQVNPDAPAQ